MTFTLAGFRESGGLRLFRFQHAAFGESATSIEVRADVALARKYDIRLQELPLICARLLESLESSALAGAVTLTEDHMIAIQRAARDAAEKKALRPPPRRRYPPRPGPSPHISQEKQ